MEYSKTFQCSVCSMWLVEGCTHICQKPHYGIIWRSLNDGWNLQKVNPEIRSCCGFIWGEGVEILWPWAVPLTLERG